MDHQEFRANMQAEERKSDRLITETSQRIPESNKLITAKEAAILLNVSEPFVYKLMQQRKIPTVIIGRSVRITRGDLDEYIKKNREVARAYCLSTING